MSRAKNVDNSAAVSLFPFLAVLLCTMGALLVVLVAVSRTARDSAAREMASAQVGDAAIVVDKDAKLAQIKDYVSKVDKVRNDAQQQLREDQLRLGHLEDHIRRLHDELAKLQIAAAEMKSLENEHYDNREQAQKELSRLEKLMGEAQAEIEKLQEEAKNRKRSYAIVPFDGQHGTLRRPLYIECVKDELILQPEGVRLTRADLSGPIGPGNPLASALRAARDYHTKLSKIDPNNRDLEPYPLLVVRPDGLIMYNRARRAIESSDFAFGFELVEQDWEVKYGIPDSQLASLEQQAIDHARMRQQALAEAAPRAYRNPGLASSGKFDYDEESGEDFEVVDSTEGGGMPGSGNGGGGDSLAEGGGGPYGGYGSNPGGNGAAANAAAGDALGGGGPDSASAGVASANGPAAGDAIGGAPGPGGSMGQPSSGAAASSSGGSSTPPPNGIAAANGGSGEGGSKYPSANAHDIKQAEPTGISDPADGQPPTSSASIVTGMPLEKTPKTTAPQEVPGQKFDRKKPVVPIQRSLQILVRGDHVVIFSDDMSSSSSTVVGKRVPMQGDTVESMNEVITAVRKEVEGWGYAGNNMYWKPQLVLHAGPGGQKRSEDLARLLKKNGYELSNNNVAAKPNEGGTRGATH